MFNNKKDVLVESVKQIMELSEAHRQIEEEIKTQFGIISKTQLPNEYHEEYDFVLSEAKKLVEAELKGRQGVLDVSGPAGRPDRKLTGHDFKALGQRAKMAGQKQFGKRVAPPVPQTAARKGSFGALRGSTPGGLDEANPVSNMVSSVKNKLGMGSKNPFDAPLGSNSARDRMINRSNPLARENQPTMVGRAITTVKNKLGMGSKNPFDAPLKEESLDEVTSGYLFGKARKAAQISDKATKMGDTATATAKADQARRIALGAKERMADKVTIPTKTPASSTQKPAVKVRSIMPEETKLDEKLTKSMSAGDVISDFVHSKDPRFKGDTKKERMKRALGAYYKMKREK